MKKKGEKIKKIETILTIFLGIPIFAFILFIILFVCFKILNFLYIISNI